MHVAVRAAVDFGESEIAKIESNVAQSLHPISMCLQYVYGCVSNVCLYFTRLCVCRSVVV